MDQIHKIHAALCSVSDHYNKLQMRSGLSCLDSCGKCCQNPNIFARPSEMLPLALSLYQQDRAIETLDKISGLLNSEAITACIFYRGENDSSGGSCGAYEFRPLVCRSFGVFLRSDKSGERDFSVCTLIKEEKKMELLLARNSLDAYNDFRNIDQLSSAFYQMDPQLSQERDDLINLSVLEAIKRVLFYYELRNKQ